MPRSSRAFLSERVRFRSGRSPTGSMLSWVSLAPLQSSTRMPWGQLPDPFPHALFTTFTRRRSARGAPGRFQHASLQGLSTLPTLLRFVTGTCPRVLPTTVMSHSDCSDQEPMRTLRSQTDGPEPDTPRLPKEDVRAYPGGHTRRPTLSKGPKSLQRSGANPQQASLFTTLSKRTFSGQAFRCQSRVSCE